MKKKRKIVIKEKLKIGYKENKIKRKRKKEK